MAVVPTYLQANGLLEHSVLFTPEIPNGSAIVFTHGWTTNSSGYSEFAQACSEIGTTCLTVDLLSHGESEGNRSELTITDYVGGLVTAYDYIAEQPQVDSSRINAMAGSFGAYLSVLLASQRPIESLLLRVPALYADGLRELPRREFNTDDALQMEPRPDNEALQIIRNFAGRVVLVSSENDDIIMPVTTEAYSNAIQDGEHIQMAGAKHVLDQPNRQVFKKILLNWAAEL